VDGEKVEAAQTRGYTLHVPANYDGEKAVGLLVALTGDGLSTKKFENMAKYQKYSDAAGFVVVYPDPFGEGAKWNHGFGKNKGGPDDVLFIQALMNEIQKTFNIDPAKIYLTGYSGGGIMAYKAASALSDQVAAVGVVAGSIGYRAEKGADAEKIQKPETPISVFFINGMKDAVVPFGVSGASKKAPAGYLSFSEAESYWTKVNGCTPKPKVRLTKNEHILFHIYNDCSGGVSVEAISMVTGDHTWPTGIETSKKKNAVVTIDGTEHMWSFFMAHPKPVEEKK